MKQKIFKKAQIGLLMSVFSIHLIIFSLSLAQAETSQPAQSPLVSWKALAAPNVMVIFDTSLSMGKSFIPENALNDLTGSSYSSGNGARVTFHPEDYISSRTTYNGYGSDKRVVPTEIGDSQAAAMAAVMRCPQHNLIYYNPSTNYVPWLNADGTFMADAPPTAAPLTVARPFVQGLYGSKVDGPKPAVNLVGTQNYLFDISTPSSSHPYPQSTARYYLVWDKRLGSRYDYETKTGNFNITPATYFIYKFGLSRLLELSNAPNLVNLNNYIHVAVKDIDSHGLNVSQLYRNAGYNTSDPLQANYIYIDRPDCNKNADGDYICSQEAEYQNFANWFTYYRSRTLAGLGALTHVLFKNYSFNFRYGWADFIERSTNMVDGVLTGYIRSGVRPSSQFHNQAFLNWAAEIEGDTNDTTPTRGALGAVGEYFSRTDNKGPWGDNPGSDASGPQLACRRNYSIIVTDGRWNSSSALRADSRTSLDAGPEIYGPDGLFYQYHPVPPYVGNRTSTSQTLSDVALYYWYQDLRADMPNIIEPMSGNAAFWQHMVTHVVAFGLYNEGVQYPDDWERLQNGSLEWPRAYISTSDAGEQGRTADMWHTAVNGHGAYIPSSNPMELIRSLTSIMENLAIATVRAAGSTTESTQMVVDNVMYVPSYTNVSWVGDLISYEIARSGKPGAIRWQASDGIPAATARNIWIGTAQSGNTAVEFKPGLIPSQLQAFLPTNDLINYLRGDFSKEDDIIFRRRETRLGDIVNSNPVYLNQRVSYEYKSLSPGSSYWEYVQSKNSDKRLGIVFIGANDGMLHAFATDGPDIGKEVFAFIPHALGNKLSSLASPNYEHLYYVDGPLILTDAYWGACPIDSEKDCWHQMLLGSAGAGAKTLFALDVTNPDSYAHTSTNKPTQQSINQTVLWEITPNDPGMNELGYVMQSMQAGYINVETLEGSAADGHWVAVFGNGAYSKSGGAVLYIVDLQTGAYIGDIKVGLAGNNGLMGVSLIRDGSRHITGAYAGDLQGNLWYFDLRSSKPDNWSAHKVATTINNRPITQAPSYASHPYGGRMVLFGSGKFFDASDINDSNQETIYGVWDNNGGVVTEASLLRRTASPVTIAGTTYFKLDDSDINIDWKTQKGWYLPLNMAYAQRSLYTPTVLGSDVIFDTSITDDNSPVESCTVKTFGSISIMVNLYSGGLPSGKWDTNQDGIVDSQDSHYVGISTDNNGPGNTLFLPGYAGEGEHTDVRCQAGEIFINHGGMSFCKGAALTQSWVELF